MADSLQPHELQPVRVLYPWDSPGKNTGEGCQSFLQGIFPTQGSNPGLLHCADSLASEPAGKPIQSLSNVQLSETPWTAAHQASLSFTISQSLFRLMSIESMMPSNHLIFCHPLSFCPQSFPASGSFPMSRLLALGSQSTGASTSVSVLPMNIRG